MHELKEQITTIGNFSWLARKLKRQKPVICRHGHNLSMDLNLADYYIKTGRCIFCEENL